MPFPDMLHSPLPFGIFGPLLAKISRVCTGYVSDPGELRSLLLLSFLILRSSALDGLSFRTRSAGSMVWRESINGALSSTLCGFRLAFGDSPKWCCPGLLSHPARRASSQGHPPSCPAASLPVRMATQPLREPVAAHRGLRLACVSRGGPAQSGG
jgi:hypothetical protein